MLQRGPRGMAVVMEGVTASREVLTRRAVPFFVGPGAYLDGIASSYRTCSLTLCNLVFRDLYPSAATYAQSMRNSHLAPASRMDHGGHGEMALQQAGGKTARKLSRTIVDPCGW